MITAQQTLYTKMFVPRQTPSERPPDEPGVEKFRRCFFLETLEHLIDDYFAKTLEELNRLLKVGGHLILTTRNDENLNELKVMCPDCGAIFHKVQHVRSFTMSSVKDLLSRYGFETVKCFSVDLSGSRNKWVRLSKKIVKKIAGYNQGPKPNLIYIGQKIR